MYCYKAGLDQWDKADIKLVNFKYNICGALWKESLTITGRLGGTAAPCDGYQRVLMSRSVVEGEKREGL